MKGTNIIPCGYNIVEDRKSRYFKWLHNRTTNTAKDNLLMKVVFFVFYFQETGNSLPDFALKHKPFGGYYTI